MPRKHLIASQTNKKQQAQAKTWQKLAREIRAAVKVGGPNPEANPRLKSAINKALQNNLSRDSINKNINGGNKDNEKLETLEYEAYGPNGIQIIICALTDNPNRTAGNIRGYLNKFNANLAKPNSVKSFFEEKGYIIIPKKPGISVDNLLELTMENKILDIFEQEDCFEIYVEPLDIYKTVDNLKNNNVEVFSSETKFFPNQQVTELDDKTKQKLFDFIEACENDDDIQWVVTNFEEY
ncbi:MAG: YebC/PmpR family DNA-binding transcriptional regulator [Mycoplasma sp.]|nr:YebC/PmpR family DNA-binding transcriptional regulator [Mycoplasma sp.]